MRKVLVLFCWLLAVQVHAATVIVTSNPKGADVVIDGKPAGKTPCRKSLLEGSHELTLKKDEYQDLVQTVEVGKKLVMLRLELNPKTYPIDIMFENISPDTMGWHIFTPSGNRLGSAPGTVLLTKGKHKVVLIKDGFQDVTLPVEVIDQQVVVLKEPVKGQSSWNKLQLASYLGEWIKVDTGTVLTIKGDMSCYTTSRTGVQGSSGVWKLVATGISIKLCVHNSSSTVTMVLALQKNGILQGRDSHRHMWCLKKTK